MSEENVAVFDHDDDDCEEEFTGGQRKVRRGNDEFEDLNDNDEDSTPRETCEFVANIPETLAATNPDDVPPLALLPPDHPLLHKFQQSLKEYLLRTRDKLINEIEEIKYSVKQKEQLREEQGATLYDMQQEIQRQNDQLEEFAEQIQENLQQRQHEEEAVHRLKAEYDEKAQMSKAQKTQYNKRMAELENMQELEKNIRKWTVDVEDEVKNAKRVVSRDSQLQQQLSDEKRKSDLLFYHLDVEVKRSEKELEIVQNEVKDMEEVKDVLNMSVSNANADLEALESEHKRLTQAWSEVIVAISLRDRILYQVQEATNKEKETIKLNTAGVESIQKQIHKELELNEKLEIFKKRLSDDFTILRRECKIQSDILAGLEEKLMEIPILLEQTEKDLKEAKKEGTNLDTEIRRIQLRIDKQYNKKYETEENILKLAQEQLITDKASEYRLKLLNNSQEQRRCMELNLAQAQNQLAETLLEMERYKANNFRMSQENEKLNDKLMSMESKSDYLITELKQLETQIEIKMKRMDKLNNQLDELVRSEGHEISPTELKIKQMEKSIQATDQQIREYQQFWIMLQNHFVNLSQKRNSQMNQIQTTRKQLSIIKQKSLKLDQELEQSETATKELNRDIQIYQSKLELLNAKIAKKRQQHESVENECEHEHGELLEKLKDNEMRVLQLEDDINELQNEIEHYKDVVLDKHRESLSWETKYKLIDETLRWRKEEGALDSELGTMRTEIHRMQIRHQQLKRAQEKLIQDLDHCVMHREQISSTASNKQTLEQSKPFKIKQNSTTIQYKINDLRNKLKQMQSEIGLLSDHQIIQVNIEYGRIEDDIKRLRSDIEEETSQDAKIRAEIEAGLLLKHQNLENIIRKQNRAKSYRRLNAAAQPLKLPRSEATILGQMQKQVEMNDHLIDAIQALGNEHPEKQTSFSKLLQILKN